MRRADMKESAAPILDEVAVTMADGAGRFAFLGVPSGRFTIWAVTQGSDPLNASPAITVGDADVSGVEIALRPSPRVTGRVAFEGSTPPPPAAALRSLRITLDSADGQRGGPVVLAGGGPPRLAVDTTGALAGTGLLPGSYLVRVEMIPAGWFLKSVTAGGVNVADDVPLALSQSVDGLVVTLTEHDTALSGTVRTATGANDLTASVVVFPRIAGCGRTTAGRRAAGGPFAPAGWAITGLATCRPASIWRSPLPTQTRRDGRSRQRSSDSRASRVTCRWPVARPRPWTFEQACCDDAPTANRCPARMPRTGRIGRGCRGAPATG